MMRSKAWLVLAGTVALVWATSAQADNAATLVTGFGASITSMKQQTSIYAGGPLTIRIDVHNDGNQPHQVQVAFFAPSAGLSAQTIDMKPEENRTLQFIDSVGFSNLCRPRDYTAQVMSGTSRPVSENTRTARVAPSCTFSAKSTNPWNQMSPDRVDAVKTGMLWSSDIKVENTPTCAQNLKIEVTVVNHSKHEAKNVIAKLTNASGAPEGQSAPFTIAPGGYKAVTFSADQGAFGKLGFALVDPSNSLAGALVNQGMTVDVAAIGVAAQ